MVNAIAAAIIHPDPTSYTYSTIKTPLSPRIVSRMPSKRYSLSDLQELELEQLKAKQNSLEEQAIREEETSSVVKENRR